jgi:hypothetical protein
MAALNCPPDLDDDFGVAQRALSYVFGLGQALTNGVGVNGELSGSDVHAAVIDEVPLDGALLRWECPVRSSRLNQ